MRYPDRFLAALGAWQQGWRECKDRRLSITNELLSAIAELPSTLPVSNPIPHCYRKRYLVPNNPQNNGDMQKLILEDRIDEGIASWTADKKFGEAFKDLFRQGCVTALFEHLPRAEEVVVDLVALWQDPEFVKAVDSYSSRNGDNATALQHMGDTQGEIILNSPLRAGEVVDFVGFVGDADVFFDALGAQTEDERDAVWKALVKIDALPGDARWTGRVGAQRALQRTRSKQAKKYAARLWHLQYKEFLLAHSHFIPPWLFQRTGY